MMKIEQPDNECRRRKGEGVSKAAQRAILAAFVIIGFTSSVLADGGTLRTMQRCGELQVSVFTSPEVLRVGEVDVSVLVQEVKGDRRRDDVPIVVRLERLDAAAIPLEKPATTVAATNKLFRAALFDVPQAGLWRATIWFGEGEEAASVTVDLPIAPPLPPWLSFLPWLGWPFLAMGLFLVHQWLKTKSSQLPRYVEYPNGLSSSGT